MLASLVRRARRDGYESMEGWVLAENTAMLALAREFDFDVEPDPGGEIYAGALRNAKPMAIVSVHVGVPK